MAKEKIRIVLADDDPDDRELFAEAVNDSDADIDVVANGIQLMKTLSSDSLPDFIFLDLNMPEKNGKECLQEIRRHDRLKNLPVIIYSTSSSKRDIDETFELGANLYITKPNSFRQLRDILSEVLQFDWSKYRPGSRRGNFVYPIS